MEKDTSPSIDFSQYSCEHEKFHYDPCSKETCNCAPAKINSKRITSKTADHAIRTLQGLTCCGKGLTDVIMQVGDHKTVEYILENKEIYYNALKTQFDRYVASVAMLGSHVGFVKLKKSDEPGVKPGTIVASYDTDLVRHYMRQNSLTQ